MGQENSGGRKCGVDLTQAHDSTHAILKQERKKPAFQALNVKRDLKPTYISLNVYCLQALQQMY